MNVSILGECSEVEERFLTRIKTRFSTPVLSYYIHGAYPLDMVLASDVFYSSLAPSLFAYVMTPPPINRNVVYVVLVSVVSHLLLEIKKEYL